jgi:hypothetical protein
MSKQIKQLHEIGSLFGNGFDKAFDLSRAVALDDEAGDEYL